MLHTVKTTGLAGGLHRPYKGLIQPRLKTHERFANRKFVTGCPPSGGGSLFAFDYRLTRKRVFELSEAHLVAGDVLLKLVPYVLFYCLFISPYRVYIVSPAPEVPVAILVLEVSVPVEDHKATLSFEISYDF